MYGEYSLLRNDSSIAQEDYDSGVTQGESITTTSLTTSTPLTNCVNDDCDELSGRFELLYEVFIPGICVFALLICCSRVIFTYLRHRLDRQFLERHGMTRSEFIASIDTMERQPQESTITEREWRFRQMLSFSTPPSPPTYDEVSKQQPPPTYEQASAQNAGQAGSEGRRERRRRRNVPPSAPPPYEPVNSISARVHPPPRSRSVRPSTLNPSDSRRNRSRSAPVNDLNNQCSSSLQNTDTRVSIRV